MFLFYFHGSERNRWNCISKFASSPNLHYWKKKKKKFVYLNEKCLVMFLVNILEVGTQLANNTTSVSRLRKACCFNVYHSNVLTFSLYYNDIYLRRFTYYTRERQPIPIMFYYYYFAEKWFPLNPKCWAFSTLYEQLLYGVIYDQSFSNVMMVSTVTWKSF